MLRYLTVAAVLLALAGTGCSNKAEPRKSTGDGPAATNATSPATGSTIKSDAGRGASTTKCGADETGRRQSRHAGRRTERRRGAGRRWQREIGR